MTCGSPCFCLSAKAGVLFRALQNYKEDMRLWVRTLTFVSSKNDLSQFAEVITMIDTLRIWIPLKSPLDADVVSKLLIDSGKNRSYCKKIVSRERYQIIPPKNLESGRICAQCSLPKFANGSNVEPLSFDQTVDAAKKFIEAVASDLKLGCTPSLDEVQVVWADIVFDWIVENPEAYLAVLRAFIIERANHELSFIKSGTDRGSTIKLGSKRHKLTIYNKQAQVEHQNLHGEFRQHVIDKAQGRLRAEVRLMGRGWGKYLQDESPNLQQVLDYIKKDGRRALALDWARITEGWESNNIEADLVRLIDKFGTTKGRQVGATLALIRNIGVPTYRQICKPSASNFWHFRSALKIADVPLMDSTGLPCLCIPWFDVEDWRARRYWSCWHMKESLTNSFEEIELDDKGDIIGCSRDLLVNLDSTQAPLAH